MNKLGFTFKEVGRLTLRTFNKFYTHYKNTFDLEMRMKNNNTTYADKYAEQQKTDEWF